LKAAQQEETALQKAAELRCNPRVGTGVQCGGGHAAFVRAVDAEEKALNSERALMPSMWKCRWSRQAEASAQAAADLKNSLAHLARYEEQQAELST
jgi:hypothetical protein